MQGKKHKDALQWYKYNLCEPSKTRRKRAIQPLKSRILGVKSGLLGLKMVQNAGFILKNSQVGRRGRLEIAAFYLLYDLYFC